MKSSSALLILRPYVMWVGYILYLEAKRREETVEQKRERRWQGRKQKRRNEVKKTNKNRKQVKTTFLHWDSNPGRSGESRIS